MSDSWEDKPIEPVGAPKANPFANLAASASEWKPNFGASEFVPTFGAPAAAAAAPAPAPAPVAAPSAAVEKPSPKAAAAGGGAAAAPAKALKKADVKDDEGDVVVPTSHLNLNSDERSGLDEDEGVAVVGRMKGV
jgi:hypothetical protein